MNICGLSFPDIYFLKHFEKRKREKLITERDEYLNIIKSTIKNAEKFYIVKQFSDCKEKLVFYYDKWCVWILIEEMRIITAFYLREENMDVFFKNRNIKKGLKKDCIEESYIEVSKDENTKYGKLIRAIQGRC